MQSNSDNFPLYMEREAGIPLSRVDLMVTFHMLRNAQPSLSLAVRNQAILQDNTTKFLELDTVSNTITALCKLKAPDSIELKKTLSKLLNRWMVTEKILQDIQLN